MLQGHHGEFVLVWDPKGPAPEAPPGKYKVRTTRIARDNFLISSAGVPEPSIEIGAEKAELKLDETVKFEGHAKRKGARLELGFAIKGADGRGLTVYKDGVRVPVTYKVLAADGAVLAEGTMNYG